MSIRAYHSSNAFVEYEGIDGDGNLILFGYNFNFNKIKRFLIGVKQRNLNGIIVCFDFQRQAFEKIRNDNIHLKVINTEVFREKVVQMLGEKLDF